MHLLLCLPEKERRCDYYFFPSCTNMQIGAVSSLLILLWCENSNYPTHRRKLAAIEPFSYSTDKISYMHCLVRATLKKP